MERDACVRVVCVCCVFLFVVFFCVATFFEIFEKAKGGAKPSSQTKAKKETTTEKRVCVKEIKSTSTKRGNLRIHMRVEGIFGSLSLRY